MVKDKAWCPQPESNQHQVNPIVLFGSVPACNDAPMLLGQGVVVGTGGMMKRSFRWRLVAAASLSVTMLPLNSQAYASDSCQKFVGSWAYPSGGNLEVRADGTAIGLCDICDTAAHWKCSGNQFELVGALGSGAKLTLSSDARQMSGNLKGGFGIGPWNFTFVRQSPMPAPEVATSAPVKKHTAVTARTNETPTEKTRPPENARTPDSCWTNLDTQDPAAVLRCSSMTR
jgi:hypothetical protein